MQDKIKDLRKTMVGEPVPEEKQSLQTAWSSGDRTGFGPERRILNTSESLYLIALSQDLSKPCSSSCSGLCLEVMSYEFFSEHSF